ncbi:sugar nucleotide-binding protein [Acetobacter sp. TBRC 12305]|uniref:Complex I NDUFA9 subunit family protein n=1 Tax=Acetobacter garciniae TaxID=2817435 RepID=A0A939HNX0_9PROT|nr:complex I NDUFA9 subunit family protein [Acetobacter garciniae]MBO1326640.1 complex I NDUFA9 subunit family protein [Acetobacter garciniae]MBX0346340.1 sugar nucleotide-binding protein [Acetobacter garciniae]
MYENGTAVVFGGSGFVGRYVVQCLAQAGYMVRVANRRPDQGALLRSLGDVGQIAPFYASVLDDYSVASVMRDADVAINLVGVLSSTRGQRLEAVNVDGAGRVARFAAEAGVGRYVHMSALGASATAPSAYGRSRAAGEDAVRRHRPDAAIVRPSLIFGREDHFFNRFAALARYLPVMPVYEPDTRIQPVYVGDVAQVITRLATQDGYGGRVWPLGGPDVMTMCQIARFVLAETRRSKPVLVVPRWLARLQAGVLERLPGAMLTRDQLLMLSRDNVMPGPESGFEPFGITPRSVASCVPAYLDRFRPGGERAEMAVDEL